MCQPPIDDALVPAVSIAVSPGDSTALTPIRPRPEGPYLPTARRGTMASPDDGTLDRAALARGGALGVVAYLLGYVLTYAWQGSAVSEQLRGINAITRLLGGQRIPTWKAVGWLYYNAQFVATRIPALGGGSRMVNFVQQSDDGTLVLLYVLVPVLLVLAGAVAARYGRTDRVGTAAAAGATVVVGYFPVAVVGALAVGHSLGGQFRVAPDLITAVALAGLVYPAFFGAVGGGLWYWLASVLDW